MRNAGIARALRSLESALLARQGMALPLTAVAVVAAADLLAGRDHFIAPGMVVAPALAAITTTWRRVLLIAALGFATQLILAPYDGIDAPRDRALFGGQLIAYVVVSLFGAYIAWRRETGLRAFTAITSVAEAAQRALLRPPGPRVGDVRLAVRYVSAADAAQIGGDLYAVLDTPHGVRVLIGDVRGKGLDAVQTSAVVLGAFREAAYDEGGLTRVAERVEASVRRHVESGEFTTALFAEFDGPGSVELLHYGHVAPLRIDPEGKVTTLDPPDPWVPLGLGEFVKGMAVPWRVVLGGEDVLVLCTDGVIEARSPLDGSFYPLASRVGPLVAGLAQNLEAAVERVYADLLEHAGGSLGDDVVLLLLAPAQAARIPV
ncbi:PP2C family protein-serine/threonine phosphatase [Streptomyces sp. H10-C2]|uniref:PP2C family protein-serine/threonine phosphatase n=1 Tax=unclassified Streptomyces TaxID=2593676 RepID=UPI0024BB02FD|nr:MULTISPECIES: PP2C family protein-serine/threonine phosphatase [unclassified Streptomyces]MDJ0339973.1 PP2C family protein-serine/threonine phosphatase [Streptomyces sp. PH10-H1]MDJ0369390.1 PP2C family protein-serine/threonine phosphatase [Streptomyces sp. H10-C2]